MQRLELRQFFMALNHAPADAVEYVIVHELAHTIEQPQPRVLGHRRAPLRITASVKRRLKRYKKNWNPKIGDNRPIVHILRRVHHGRLYYEVIEKIGVLSENPKGWRKELNLSAGTVATRSLTSASGPGPRKDEQRHHLANEEVRAMKDLLNGLKDLED